MSSFDCRLLQLVEIIKNRDQEYGLSDLFDKYGGAKGLAIKLKTDLDGGIATVDDLDDTLKERRNVYGKNEIPTKESPSFLELCWEAAQDATLIMLFVCAIVAIILGTTVECDPSKGWIEGFAILLAIAVVILVTATTDKQKDNQFKKLQADQENLKETLVHRKGERISIPPSDLVVGDVVELTGGDIIPTDGILISGVELLIDEAALTGEADAVHKTPDDKPFLLSGTSVRSGTGKMLVVCVGLYSQEGTINRLITGLGQEEVERLESLDNQVKSSSAGKAAMDGVLDQASSMDDAQDANMTSRRKKAAQTKESILTAKLNQLALDIGKYGAYAAGVCAFVLFIRNLVYDVYGVCQEHTHDYYYVGDSFSNDFTDANREAFPTYSNGTSLYISGYTCEFEEGWPNSNWKVLLHVVMTAVTVLVVAIPEGLPLAVTISLAYSVQKMMADQCLVRVLASCETMGNANTVCSDKTGTLTENKMSVVAAYFGCDASILKDLAVASAKLSAGFKQSFAQAIAINSNDRSEYKVDAQGNLEQSFNPTECAILKFADGMHGEDYKQIRAASVANGTVIHQINFDSKRKRMTTVVKHGAGFRVYVKGAVDMLTQFVTKFDNGDETTKAFTDADRDAVSTTIVPAFGKDALRTLLLAYKDVDVAADWTDEDSYMNDLVLMTIVGIQDPERKTVPGAVDTCRAAGVIVRMVTGDHKDTARAIAKNCHILTEAEANDPDCIMTGPEFRKRCVIKDGVVNQAEINKISPKLKVMARCSPEDKYHLVKGLIAAGQIVAVTGDGTNDAPALAEADVGFSMGIAGTQVAQAASDIVIQNDDFASIVKAISWGRNVYDAISKFLVFQLTVNVVAVLIVFICAVITGATPLGALQLLWVNMIMDTLASLALATEPPRPELMKREPYKRDCSVVSKPMLLMMCGHTFYQMAVMFFTCFYAHILFDIEYGLQVAHGCGDAPGLRHMTITFNVFVWMQLFNEVNARRIAGERNVFDGLLQNPFFYTIMIIQCVGQAVICQFGGSAFKIDPDGLDGAQWVYCLAFGAGELLWHQIILCFSPDIIPDFLENIFVIKLKEGGEEGEDEDAAPLSAGRPRSGSINSLSSVDSKTPASSGWGKIRNNRRLWTQVQAVAAFNSVREQAKARKVQEAGGYEMTDLRVDTLAAPTNQAAAVSAKHYSTDYVVLRKSVV